MQIAKFYSHLNGWEHIQVHKPTLWQEIAEVIATIDAAACLTKVSQESRTMGQLFYSPVDMNTEFKKELTQHGWTERRTRYFVTDDHLLILRTMQMSAEAQKQEIIKAGKVPILSYNQTDFVKDRIEIEVQFGKYSFVAYDLFVKHMAFFVGDIIDVGIEILPMGSLQENMPSETGYWEEAVRSIMLNGGNIPSVPLVLIGVIE